MVFFDKHPCYKTCYCEGRTTKDIEVFNIITSFAYLIVAMLINTFKTIKLKHLIINSLIILFFGSTIFHYHYYNYAAFLDILGIILVLISFIIIKKNLSINLYYITVLLTIIISNLYFKELFFDLLPIPLIIICFILILYYIFFYKITTPQLIITICFIIFWVIDRISPICLHWLFHLLSAYLFYDLAKHLK